MSSHDFFQSLYLFEELSEDQLQWLVDHHTDKSITAGDDLFRQGDMAESFYIVKSGTVEVTSKGEKVGELGAKDLLGEMSYLTRDVRASTITAKEPSVLIEITYDQLDDKGGEDRDFAAKVNFAFARHLAKTVTRMTQDFTMLKDLKIHH